MYARASARTNPKESLFSVICTRPVGPRPLRSASFRSAQRTLLAVCEFTARDRSNVARSDQVSWGPDRPWTGSRAHPSPADTGPDAFLSPSRAPSGRLLIRRPARPANETDGKNSYPLRAAPRHRDLAGIDGLPLALTGLFSKEYLLADIDIRDREIRPLSNGERSRHRGNRVAVFEIARTIVFVARNDISDDRFSKNNVVP